MLAGDIVVTGCQVEPPSVDTSTPATTPPPESVAVPLTVTVLPLVKVAPADGEVIVEVGGEVLVRRACQPPGQTSASLAARPSWPAS